MNLPGCMFDSLDSYTQHWPLYSVTALADAVCGRDDLLPHLLGPVVKAAASRAAGSGFDSRLRRVESYQ